VVPRQALANVPPTPRSFPSEAPKAGKPASSRSAKPKFEFLPWILLLFILFWGPAPNSFSAVGGWYPVRGPKHLLEPCYLVIGPPQSWNEGRKWGFGGGEPKASLGPQTTSTSVTRPPSGPPLLFNLSN